mmetsp:Transcript_36578/g.105369  ORF Transcript_36578/g.105369 Transcript_36578/m.105369 type:complete len:85 (+) Transcript_36578:209-463(+)
MHGACAILRGQPETQVMGCIARASASKVGNSMHQQDIAAMPERTFPSTSALELVSLRRVHSLLDHMSRYWAESMSVSQGRPLSV